MAERGRPSGRKSGQFEYFLGSAGLLCRLGTSRPSLRDALDYPLIQVSRLPPRALKPLLEFLGASSKTDPPHPVHAIDCPTVPLAVSTVLGSDAVMIASLGMVKRELELGLVMPLFHEGWMHTNWSFMKLRHRSLGPAAPELLAHLRAAFAAGAAEEAALEQEWATRLPPRAVQPKAGISKRSAEAADDRSRAAR